MKMIDSRLVCLWAVLNWFGGIQHKEKHSFIAFDVVDFYPSISMSLLITALQFASNYVNITDEERHIILHAKQSLLYNTGEPWGKKSSSGLFDVTMGSFDGAETCELVDAYLLHYIRETHDYNFGLYACQTSNKPSTATTNPFYTRKSCRQDLAIVEWKQNALWVETASRNRLFISDRLDRRSPPSPDLRGTNRKFFQNKILKP